jgi:K+-sensing histidine kinase KdpD
MVSLGFYDILVNVKPIHTIATPVTSGQQVVNFMREFLRIALRTTTGVALSAAAAILLAIGASSRSAKALIPWVFILILVALSSRYGPMVSLIGSVIAVIVFSRMVYAPVGSVAVSDETAKASLAWMALISVVSAYLLFPPSHPRHRA